MVFMHVTVDKMPTIHYHSTARMGMHRSEFQPCALVEDFNLGLRFAPPQASIVPRLRHFGKNAAQECGVPRVTASVGGEIGRPVLGKRDLGALTQRRFQGNRINWVG
jgi:hypothetical protein